MIVLIIGLPNAGKTSYSKRFSGVIHFDEYMGKYKEGFRALEQKDGAVVEGLFLTGKVRLQLLESCRHMGKKTCVLLDTPIDLCLTRSALGRDESVVLRSSKIFEPPTYDEGWDEIIIIRDGAEIILER